MSTAKDDSVALNRAGDWAKYMKPEDVAAFKCGYVFAFEALRGTEDLAEVLSNFAALTEALDSPSDDNWVTEAKDFVSELYGELDMTYWLEDSNGPIDRDSIIPKLFPNDLPRLSEAVHKFLDPVAVAINAKLKAEEEAQEKEAEA